MAKKPDSERFEGVSLADLMGALRTEIDTARERLQSSGTEGLLQIDSAEVEVLVTITKTTSAEGSGGLKFSVFGIGAEAGAKLSDSDQAQTAHRIKIVLKPVEGKALVAGE
jgi:hypothetical protein